MVRGHQSHINENRPKSPSGAKPYHQLSMADQFENPQKVGVYEGGQVFGPIFVNMALTTSNHNKKLFRTYELLMLADIHFRFRQLRIFF